MEKNKDSESVLVKKLSKEQKRVLTELRSLIKKGKIENKSDLVWANRALTDLNKGEMHESTIAWLTALVRRAGCRFVLQGEIEIPKSKKETLKNELQK